MQLCQFLPCVALKLALVEKFGHFRVGLHGFHCRVQLAAITREQACILNIQMIMIHVHLPKNLLGLVVNGLCFSPDSVFSIRCIHVLHEIHDMQQSQAPYMATWASILFTLGIMGSGGG